MRITNFLFLLLIPFASFSQTIAEKKASLIESGGDLSSEAERFLQQINLELNEARSEEKRLSQEAYNLYLHNANEQEYHEILQKIRDIRAYIATLQESWRDMISSQGKQEGYALWYQPETTLEQLIIDYGSQDYVYIMKPEVGAMKISVDSNLPIPRASWNEILELILTQNGVGIRQLNPYLRELYLLKNDRSNLRLITNKRDDLELFSPDTRVAFVLTPEPEDVRRIWFFLDHFANPESSSVQLVGRDILLVAKISDIYDMLRLYDFVSSHKGHKEYRAIPLSKVGAEDMAKVLRSVFNQAQETAKAYKAPEGTKQREVAQGPEANGLQVFTLGSESHTIFLLGTTEEVRKAEDVVREIESQIGGVRDKVIYWYTTRHSDAIEMADVLAKVYNLMVASGVGYEQSGPADGGPGAGPGVGPGGGPPGFPGGPPQQPPTIVQQRTTIESAAPPPPPPPPPPDFFLPPELYPTDPYFQRPIPPISPAYVFPAVSGSFAPRIDMGNFIVDLKTGSIVMVVEAALLPKIKELIRKMDVPKKMVQLEVLLFERRLTKENDYGLNLLRLGSAAKNINAASLLFNLPDAAGNPTGIFDFMWSRKQSHNIPAFDLVYRFLLTQDEVTINANPSVLTVNQTPAFISIQEEISINTGILEIETAKGVTLKDAFQRAQYGITLKITPTIHMPDEEEELLPTIALDSDITFDTFDTINIPANQQPNVTRRNVKNLTRVADGETVIIGGLRRRNTEDSRESIPFIGEIPGIGKLFSDYASRDDTTEMFIFITPKIVIDPACDLEYIRQEELRRRPGDIPEFLCELVCAREWESRRLFEGWLTTLFGRDPGRCYSPGWHDDDTCATQTQGEYDGR